MAMKRKYRGNKDSKKEIDRRRALIKKLNAAVTKADKRADALYAKCERAKSTASKKKLTKQYVKAERQAQKAYSKLEKYHKKY